MPDDTDGCSTGMLYEKNDVLLDMFANRLLEVFRQRTVDVLQALGEVLDVT